jgi:hypothetical protein
MLRLPVFLSLLGNVTAIDIWLRWASGGNVLCSGIAPDTCCGVVGNSGSPFKGIDFQAIPSNWNIGVRGHRGPQCGVWGDYQLSSGRGNVVLENGPFGGGGYGFVSSKRSEGVNGFTEVVRPSILTLADGVQYNVTELDDASFAEMVRATFLLSEDLRQRTYADDTIL